MATKLFDSKGQATEALQEVLRLTGVDHDGTLVGIRNSTQSTWYQTGKIRADIGEEHADLKTALMPYFMKLGLIDPIKAKGLLYDTTLVLGATLVAVRKRLDFLMMEWERGVRFGQIVLIGSGRPLTPKEIPDLLNSRNPELPFDDEWVNTSEIPATEGRMMRLVYDQAQTIFPWTEKVEVHFSIHPGKANTEETIQHWLGEAKPLPSACLAVSSQPFVADQELGVGKILPVGFQVEAIGYAAPPSIAVTAFLDALAKLIYKLAE
jgi:hypothetical protein